MARPSPAEVIAFIAREEPLARTLQAFPGLSREDVRGLLEACADAARSTEARELARAPAPGAPLPGRTAPASKPEAVRSTEARELSLFPAPEPGAPVPGRKAAASKPAAAGPGEPGPVRDAASRAHPRLIVYSDGAARGNPGPAGAGAVLCAPDGSPVEKLGKYLGINTNNYAEYSGLLLGLRRALKLGARQVDVRADSELMVKQLQGKYRVKAPNLQPLYQEARALLRRFDRVTIAHVYREQNQHADEMSNRAIDERM